MMEIWGTGSPKRVFARKRFTQHVFILLNSEHPGCCQTDGTHINGGTKIDHSISRLAEIISGIVGMGPIKWTLQSQMGRRENYWMF